MGCATVDDYWDNGHWAAGKLNYESAIKQYTKAIKKSKDDWELANSYKFRGDLLFKIGLYDQAVSDFSEMIKFGERSGYMKKGYGYIERGNSYLALKEYQLAIEDFSEYMEFNEADPVGYSSRGDAYYAQGDVALSQNDYDRAIKLYNLATQADPVMEASVFETWKSTIQKYWNYFQALPDMNNQAKLIIKNIRPGNITVNYLDDKYVHWSDCVSNISSGQHKIIVDYDWNYRTEKREMEGFYLKTEQYNAVNEFARQHDMDPPFPSEDVPLGALHIREGSRTFTTTVTQNFVSGNIYEVIYSHFDKGLPVKFAIKNISQDEGVDFVLNGTVQDEGVMEVPAGDSSYYVRANGNDRNDGLSEDSPFRTLYRAVDAANKGNIKTITILGTLNAVSEGQNSFYPNAVFVITGTSGVEITIRGREEASEAEQGVLSAAGAGKQVISITKEARIRLEHIRIEGGNSKSFGAGICVEQLAQVTLGEGAVVQNNHSLNGGGVVVYEGIFTMEDGEISKNTAEDVGGGVMVFEGIFTMQSGKISGNTAQFGGGVEVDRYGSFIMEGGTISDNTAEVGGGVGIIEDGTFTMSSEARIHTNNAVGLLYNPSGYSSIAIGENFTGPTGPVAKIDLLAEFDPASSWLGKAVLKPAEGYSGNLSTLKDRFMLGNFIHQEGRGTDESPYTSPAIPITGYEIGDDGTLQASGW
jgi:tetratricopeptide (TPR) repeat protein